jgi:hypothetical protein
MTEPIFAWENVTAPLPCINLNLSRILIWNYVSKFDVKEKPVDIGTFLLAGMVLYPVLLNTGRTTVDFSCEIYSKF